MTKKLFKANILENLEERVGVQICGSNWINCAVCKTILPIIKG